MKSTVQWIGVGICFAALAAETVVRLLKETKKEMI